MADGATDGVVTDGADGVMADGVMADGADGVIAVLPVPGCAAADVVTGGDG